MAGGSWENGSLLSLRYLRVISFSHFFVNISPRMAFPRGEGRASFLSLSQDRGCAFIKRSSNSGCQLFNQTLRQSRVQTKVRLIHAILSCRLLQSSIKVTFVWTGINVHQLHQWFHTKPDRWCFSGVVVWCTEQPAVLLSVLHSLWKKLLHFVLMQKLFCVLAKRAKAAFP